MLITRARLPLESVGENFRYFVNGTNQSHSCFGSETPLPFGEISVQMVRRLKTRRITFTSVLLHFVIKKSVALYDADAVGGQEGPIISIIIDINKSVTGVITWLDRYYKEPKF